MNTEFYARRGGFGFGGHGETDLPWPWFLVALVIALVVAWTVWRSDRRHAAASRAHVHGIWQQLAADLRWRHDLVGYAIGAVSSVIGTDDADLQRVGTVHAWAVAQRPAGPATGHEIEAVVAGAVDRLLTLARRHPDLTRDPQITALMDQLRYAGERIAYGAHIYNSRAGQYNDHVAAHASKRRFQPAEYFGSRTRTDRVGVRFLD